MAAQPVRVIHMVHRGPSKTEVEKTRRSQKLRRMGEISEFLSPKKDARITFSSSDLRRIQFSQDDPLVISLMVSKCLVKRVMIDPGSSANIIIKWAFEKLEIDLQVIVPLRSPIAGFDGRKVEPVGEVQLPVTAARCTLRETFVVVDVKPSYNLLMGRGWIHRMHGVPSTIHQVMRCVDPNEVDVIDIQGDQIAVKECYAVTMKGLKKRPEPGQTSKAKAIHRD